MLIISSDILKRAPDEYEVLNLLADISNQWNEIGLSLRVDKNILDSLAEKNQRNKVKLAGVIQSWINTRRSPVMWETLISAIEGPIVGNNNKANEIRGHLGILAK